MSNVRELPTLALPLPSALEDFTSEFEMGSGGALPVWLPYIIHDFTKYLKSVSINALVVRRGNKLTLNCESNILKC